MSFWFHVESPTENYEPYERNVTYNVSSILKLAGFHPAVLNGVTVVKLRPVVTYVRQSLTDRPDYFRRFEPENGWGSYDGVLEFITELDAYLMDAPDEYVLRVS